ncbi:MAG TPA: NAD-dependent epimerase/dehydratase family protein [Solirubrobacterales bacterium]|nr:NAD-dependent epimerase/dehydratase family protein [Solirubrobacterales bacterium]
MGIRVAVVGATGNVGTSVLAALAEESQVEEIVGIARRLPEVELPKTRWVEGDVNEGLADAFRGADAVVHLAWAIQPSRDEATLERINVEGSARVFEAAAAAGVPALVYASSVGAYGPGPKDRAVDESWPTTGIPTSFYSRHKAAVEALLDDFESRHPEVRVVRLRPALIFKGEAASEIRRLFVGPFLPSFLVRPGLIPVVPRIAGLRFQAVHSRDVGEAYRQAVVREVRGAFNLAAEPVLDPERLAEALDARPLDVSPRVVRALTDWSWKLRLQPSPPGWLDMALRVPLMDSSRARAELGWQPRIDGVEALLELLEGIRHSQGMETPPLARETGGPARLGELRSGVGARQ